MADKSIDQLNAAERVYSTDLFVLQQSGTAKKLTGQALENWLVSFADGHGGIQSIEKIGTSGLSDTYRITLADTTTFDFVVTNGRSITGISKTSTSGLVDTYTISYNDGSTSTFTVTNGAKGDKGDNAYTWIKYASQEPTESSHSMGDIPDAWRGEYNGPLAAAPTDWKQYKWYKIKGDQGNTGDPARLLSSSVAYMVSDSGTIVPSGSWVTDVPAVPQGKYLWTRVIQTYNTGSPVTSYSVARMGIDGTGSVSSVNDVSPDAAGNVQLTPDSIGADSKKKYGKLVVFGDSLGQGVNNNDYSFVDVLSESGAFESVEKCCVGGATIGPYQKHSSATGYSLVEQIERYSSDVASADIIMLEYGANDIRSMLAGNITMGTAGDSSTTTTICGYTKKAMERIRELNPDVKIIWLAFSLNDFEYNRIKSGTNFADAELLFEATALKLARPYLASVINVAAGIPSSGMSSDDAHPNTEGHKYVANQILHNMFVPWDYPHLHRPLILSGDLDAQTNLSIDGSFSIIYELLAAGVTVTLTHPYNTNYPIVLYPSMYNEYSIVFNTAVTDDGSTWTKFSITWGKDNSITTYQNAMLKKSYVSVTSNASMAIGGTHKLYESIIDKYPVFASLSYAPAMGRVSGSAGNKTITFNNITNVGEGVYINFASFNVSDDGLTLTLGFTKRIKVSASGNTVENNVSITFGNVCIINT